MSEFPVLKDGMIQIFAVGNIAKPGGRPKQGLKPKHSARFEERVVGMARYWTAKQASATIDRLVRCYRVESVSTHDIAVVNGEQYDIKQIQYPPDLSALCMDLSLSRRQDRYEVQKNEP